MIIMMYQINKQKYVNIEKTKEMGYNDALIQDVLKQCEERTTCYLSK